MKTVLLTGAAGGIGGRLRKLLAGVYPDFRVSDVAPIAKLAPDPIVDHFQGGSFCSDGFAGDLDRAGN